MAGIIVPVLKKTPYDYSFLAAAPASQSIVLHRALNVVPYKFGRLLVRVHSSTMNDSSQTISFDCFGTDPSSEDPQEFTDTSAQLGVTLTGSSSTVAAGYLGTDTQTDLFPYLKVMVTFSQSTSGARFYIELSADLLLRES